jgi:hypothetical protein
LNYWENLIFVFLLFDKEGERNPKVFDFRFSGRSFLMVGKKSLLLPLDNDMFYLLDLISAPLEFRSGN